MTRMYIRDDLVWGCFLVALEIPVNRLMRGYWIGIAFVRGR
jgi:hypothetical protein